MKTGIRVVILAKYFSLNSKEYSNLAIFKARALLQIKKMLTYETPFYAIIGLRMGSKKLETSQVLAHSVFQKVTPKCKSL